MDGKYCNYVEDNQTIGQNVAETVKLMRELSETKVKITKRCD